MKMKYLFATAAVIIGVAAYTLTLSFTETPSAISRLEALANSEGGESGGGNEGENPETGGENPESGGGQNGYKMVIQEHYCQPFRWIAKSDGGSGTNWEIEPIGNGPTTVLVTVCKNGGPLSSCTPYDPCNPAKPQ